MYASWYISIDLNESRFINLEKERLVSMASSDQLMMDIRSDTAKLGNAQDDLTSLTKQLTAAQDAQRDLQSFQRNYSPQKSKPCVSAVGSLDYGQTTYLQSGMNEVDNDLTGTYDTNFTSLIQADLNDIAKVIQNLENNISTTNAAISSLQGQLTSLNKSLTTAQAGG